jgi:iron complex outermembrane recepter protein
VSSLRLFLLTTVCTALAAPALAQSAADPEATVVEEVVVTGRAQRLYRTPETGVARGGESALDIPQATTVINEELAADQGARDVTDLYRNVAGVTTFSYSGVTFRGFRQDQVFYDGLRGNPFIGFSVPQLFNIERVEVLKGPAGMLYGAGSPGGLINYVTKTPTDRFEAEATAVVGDNERRGGSVEVSGPVALDGRLTARGGAFYEYRGPIRVNTDSEVAILDGGLGFEVTPDLRLTLQATHYEQKSDGNRLRGVPVTNGGDFLAPVTWNHNEPTDFLDLEADVVQGRLFWDLSETTRLDAGARWSQANEIQNYHEPRALRDTNADGVVDFVDREFRDQTRDGETIAFAANLAHTARVFGMEHRLLVGGDWSSEESLSFSRIAVTNRTAGGRVPGISLVNPVYGQTSPANYNLSSITPSLGDSEAIRQGLFVQDQVFLTDKLSLVGGVRFDRFEDENRLNGTSFEEKATTLRGGVIYRPIEGLSLYASWSEGFEPQAITSQDPRAGGPFEPVTGEQVEVGAKGELMGGRLQFGIAAYDIVRQNILQSTGGDAGGDGINDVAALGEVTSTGLEVEGAFDLTPNWVVTANWAYNDARITATRPGQTITNAVGDRFANAPKYEAGLWTRYDFDTLGLSAAVGVEYVGERISLGGQTVQAYTIYDASIIKRFGDRYEALLRIDNLTDEVYAASGFDVRSGHFPGEPRSAFLELRARW